MTEGKKFALITFDYELFLGAESGTVEECILKPTSEIAWVLNRHNTKAIFFVDCYYLHVLKIQADVHIKAQLDYNAIQQQLIDLYQAGHYIYYHLHPHWADARYNEDTNTWTLSNQNKYCFSNLSAAEQTEVFDASVNALNNILQSANKYKQPNGFRAGGLYIQPFSIFKPHFEKHSIKYEFSVLMGAEGKGVDSSQHFNFLSVSKLLYRFENDIVEEDLTGNFYQYALEAHTINGVNKVINKVYSFLAARTAGTKVYGKGLPTKNKIVFDKLKYPSGKFKSVEIYSAENLNRYKTGSYITHLKQTGYLHLLSHPKLMSPYSINQLGILLSKINKLPNVSYNFKEIPIP